MRNECVRLGLAKCYYCTNDFDRCVIGQWKTSLSTMSNKELMAEVMWRIKSGVTTYLYATVKNYYPERYRMVRNIILLG